MIYKLIYFSQFFIILLAFLTSFYREKIYNFEKSPHFYFLIFFILFQFEGIFLGPYVRNEIGDGQGVYIGYFKYLLENSDSLFLKELGGGVDRFSIGRIGGEYFSLYLFLLKFFDYWQLLIFIRVLFNVIAFYGTYLLLFEIFKSNKTFSILISLFFTFCFEFNLSMNFLYGLSYSGIPLFIYLLYKQNNDLKLILATIFYSLIFVSCSFPYWSAIPNLILILLLSLIYRPSNKKLFYIFLIIHYSLWFINYLEISTAFILNISESSRIFRSEEVLTIVDKIKSSLAFLIRPLNSYLYFDFNLILIFPLIFAVYENFFVKKRKILSKFILLYFLFFLMPAFFDWSVYRSYSEYLIVIVSIFMMSEISKSNNLRLVIIFNNLIFGFLIAILLTFKSYSFINFLTFGTVKNLDKNPYVINLKESINNDYRIISLPYHLDRNTFVNYGFNTYDMQATFVRDHVHENFILINKSLPNDHISINGLSKKIFSDYTCCDPIDFSKYYDLEILKNNSVKYIFSKIPIKTSNQIKKIYSGELNSYDFNIESNNLKKYLDIDLYKVPLVNSLFLYEIINVNKILSSDSEANFTFEEIVNGYKISLKDKKSTKIFLNHPFSKWWTTNNDKVTLTKDKYGNIIINVSRNVDIFEIQYKRPKFLDFIYFNFR